MTAQEVVMTEAQQGEVDAPIHLALPQVPARWLFDLRLRLLSTDDREDRISLKITDDGGGYFCHIKANATADMGELDFLPALADGLVQMVEAISAKENDQ